MKNCRFVVLLVAIAASGCISLYRADSFEAVVVDSQTGDPIADVVAVAHWQSRAGGFPETQPGGQVEVQESVSDVQGRIRFTGFWRLSSAQYDPGADPALLLFRSGYLPAIIDNEIKGGVFSPPRRTSFQGARLRLQKVHPSEEKFKDAFTALNILVGSMATRESTPCQWKRIPRMIAALHRQDMMNRQEGQRSAGLYDELIADEEGEQKRGCGSVKEFFAKEQIE